MCVCVCVCVLACKCNVSTGTYTDFVQVVVTKENSILNVHLSYHTNEFH